MISINLGKGPRAKARVVPTRPVKRCIVMARPDDGDGGELRELIISIEGKSLQELNSEDLRNFNKMSYYGILSTDENHRVVRTKLGSDVMQGRA